MLKLYAEISVGVFLAGAVHDKRVPSKLSKNCIWGDLTTKIITACLSFWKYIYTAMDTCGCKAGLETLKMVHSHNEYQSYFYAVNPQIKWMHSTPNPAVAAAPLSMTNVKSHLKLRLCTENEWFLHWSDLPRSLPASGLPISSKPPENELITQLPPQCLILCLPPSVTNNLACSDQGRVDHTYLWPETRWCMH